MNHVIQVTEKKVPWLTNIDQDDQNAQIQHLLSFWMARKVINIDINCHKICQSKRVHAQYEHILDIARTSYAQYKA